MKIKSLLFLLFSFMTACTNQSKDNFIRFQDTVGILNCVMSDTHFQTETNRQTQTLVIIQNTYNQDNWPQHLGPFNVIYEREQSKKNEPLNSETRLYYKIEDFVIGKVNGSISVLCINKKVMLSYTVHKEKNAWKVKGISYKML